MGMKISRLAKTLCKNLDYPQPPTQHKKWPPPKSKTVCEQIRKSQRIYYPLYQWPGENLNPAGIPCKSRRGVGSGSYPAGISGKQFFPSGEATGNALEKSAGSGDHPRRSYPAAGKWRNCQQGAGCTFYPTGMSGEQYLPSGDASGDDWPGHWYRIYYWK